MTRARLLLLAAALAASPARAVEWVPVFDATLLMGQTLLAGKSSSWQGNANAQFTPAAKLSESWGLIPTYAASYQGTRSVTDLGSGGQLFQDSMAHSLRLKSVHKFGAFKLKPQIGHRWELLRETTDEGWGKGLFDYRKPSAGLEAEYAFSESVTGSVGFDWYQIRFPNYRTLESSVKGQGLGREQASARALDNNNAAWSGTLSFPSPLPGTRARLSVSWTDRTFPEQNLVTASGALSPDRRRDSLKSVGLSLGRGWRLGENAGLYAELQGSWARLDSSQNHYDASLNRFNPNFYSYEERQIMPRATLLLGRRKVEAALAYLNTRRQFVSRAAQDEGGTYTGDAQVLEQDNFLLDLAVPLGRGFKFLASSHIATARSNQRYERFFKTNYTLQTHLLGFSYNY
jgi:hypothetical protein